MVQETLLQVTVIKHLPYGLLVEMKDGNLGLIREREISWNVQDRQNWSEIYPVGITIKVVDLKKRNDKYQELSLRLAQNDPWERIDSRFRPGNIVSGVVNGVMNYGTFIQLSPGLTGLLHQSQLPNFASKNSPLEMFWPGDHVHVVVRDIQASQRRISLGLAPIDPIWQKREEPSSTDGVLAKHDEQTSKESDLDQFFKSGKFQNNIVLIEDDPQQSEVISIWLQKIGQIVRSASTGLKGLALIESDPPDIAMIDLGLPDISGLGVVHKVHLEWPNVHCVLVTDWTRAEEFSNEFDAMKSEGVRLLIKPLLPDDLIEMLLDKSEFLTDKQNRPNLTLEQNFWKPKSAAATLPQSLREIVDLCKKLTGFETIILFRLNTLHRLIEVIFRQGPGSFNQAAVESLIYSPVRDVAEDEEIILLEHLEDSDIPKFRYLLEYLLISSCLGVPISTNLPDKYALFLFDTEPHRISSNDVLFSQAIALSIGTIFEKNYIQEQAIIEQRTALLGHLTSGLIHEINHQISPINFSVESIEKGLSDIERSPSIEQTLEKIRATRRFLETLEKSVLSITNTTRQFGRILTRSKDQFIKIDEIIEECVNLIRDISDRFKVKIDIIHPKDLLIIRLQGSVLEQVFLNVLLNAVQQIEEFHPDKGGWIQIRFEMIHKSNDQKIVKVLLEDNGPGIHLRQWEKIFELGFSTRKEGSGMGLYISRCLMESIQGNIYVEESYIAGGTIFAIEIPHHI